MGGAMTKAFKFEALKMSKSTVDDAILETTSSAGIMADYMAKNNPKTTEFKISQTYCTIDLKVNSNPAITVAGSAALLIQAMAFNISAVASSATASSAHAALMFKVAKKIKPLKHIVASKATNPSSTFCSKVCPKSYPSLRKEIFNLNLTSSAATSSKLIARSRAPVLSHPSLKKEISNVFINSVRKNNSGKTLKRSLAGEIEGPRLKAFKVKPTKKSNNVDHKILNTASSAEINVIHTA